MAHRSNNQYSGIAAALRIVGECWTLLIVSELMAGPHRFTDLADELPGISTSLLSQRLKTLERYGMLHRRVLSPLTKVAVYELTPEGQALEQTLLELAKWGSEFVMPFSSGAGKSSG